MVEVAPFGKVEAADVCVLFDAVHGEVPPPAAQDDPPSGLLVELARLGERDEGHSRLGVPRVRLALSPAAVLGHLQCLVYNLASLDKTITVISSWTCR